jgi:hypothetical protein
MTFFGPYPLRAREVAFHASDRKRVLLNAVVVQFGSFTTVATEIRTILHFDWSIHLACRSRPLLSFRPEANPTCSDGDARNRNS